MLVSRRLRVEPPAEHREREPHGDHPAGLRTATTSAALDKRLRGLSSNSSRAPRQAGARRRRDARRGRSEPPRVGERQHRRAAVSAHSSAIPTPDHEQHAEAADHRYGRQRQHQHRRRARSGGGGDRGAAARPLRARRASSGRAVGGSAVPPAHATGTGPRSPPQAPPAPAAPRPGHGQRGPHQRQRTERERDGEHGHRQRQQPRAPAEDQARASSAITSSTATSSSTIEWVIEPVRSATITGSPVSR